MFALKLTAGIGEKCLNGTSEEKVYAEIYRQSIDYL